MEPLKYQPVAAAPQPAADTPAAPASGETMTVKLRWKAPDAATSEPMNIPVIDPGQPLTAASADTRWAVAIASFAELLRGTPRGSLTWDSLRQMARDSKGDDPQGYRGEFLQLIDKAQSLRGQ